MSHRRDLGHSEPGRKDHFPSQPSCLLWSRTENRNGSCTRNRNVIFFFFKHINFETERPSRLPLVIRGVASEMVPASGKTGTC